MKISITIDEKLVSQIDRLVELKLFANRSLAIQQAVSDNLERMNKSLLARECGKLDAAEEQALAEEGIQEGFAAWPQY